MNHPDEALDLSTVDAVLTHGSCGQKYPKLPIEPLDAVQVLMKIRKLGSLALDIPGGSTVDEAELVNECLLLQLRLCHVGGCGSRNHASCLETMCTNYSEFSKFMTLFEDFDDIHRRIDPVLPIKTLSEKLRGNRVPVRFNIIPKDVFRNDEDLLSQIVTTFNRQIPHLPLALFTCLKTNDNLNYCEDMHSVAITGITKTQCLDIHASVVKTFHEVQLRNSYNGEDEGPWYLEKIVEGMKKYDFGFVQVQPCNGASQPPCSNEPLISDSRSNLACHYAAAGDLQNLLQVIHQVIPERPCANGSSPLSLAATFGHVDVVKELLVRFPKEIDRSDYKGMRPLDYAIGENRLSVIELLKHPDIHLNSPGPLGHRPLTTAILERNLEWTRLLLADPRIKVNEPHPGENPLRVAIKSNQPYIVKELLKHPHLNVNLRSDLEDTPLYAAIQLGNPEIVHDLLQHPAIDVNSRFFMGNTALSVAVEKRLPQIVALLVQHKNIDLEKENLLRETPLAIAVAHNEVDIAEILLKHGADPRRAGDLSEVPGEQMKRLLMSFLTPHEDAQETGMKSEKVRERGEKPEKKSRKRKDH
jgi:ankyrin repeat protein